MARGLDIKKEWWTDPRRHQLAQELNSQELADGVMIAAWKLSQDFWADGKRKVPSYLFDRLVHSDLILKFGLATKVKRYVYVKGSKQHHQWIHDLQTKSASALKSRSNKTKPDAPVDAPTDAPVDAPLYFSSLPLPLPLPPSPKTKTKGAANAVADVSSPVGYFIGTYVRAFQSRYGEKTRPDLRGKIQGRIKKLLEEIPLERACELIQAYCQMDGEKNWFKTKGHDFETFMQNINPVAIALDTGVDQGGIDWSKVFGEKNDQRAIPDTAT